MIPKFDQDAWDDKLMNAKSFDDWEWINREYEKAFDAYELLVARDAQANPEHYETHQDKSGRVYTIDPETGKRKYRKMRICQICGDRNEEDDDDWWEEHMVMHEHKRLFDLEHNPLIRKLKVYASERWYGHAHVRRWNQAIQALGLPMGEPRAMTLEEAKLNASRFSRARWQPVVDRLETMRR